MTGEPWLAALGRRERRRIRIVGREPLAGGYVSTSVERVDLDDGRSVVVKKAAPGEVAAMRALAVVDGVARPRMLAAAGDRIVLEFHDGRPAGPDDPVPDEVWRTLALVHAHWRRNRPRGVPVVDPAWWRRLCEFVLVAVRGAGLRTGDPSYDAVAAAVADWAGDPRIARALTVLPRTLCHGDAHRGNVLLPADGSPGGGVLLDWGNARIAPAGLDVAVLTAPDPSGPADAPPGPVPAAYTATLDDPPEILAAQREWALVQVHVQYLAFAADHQPAARVTGMADVAAGALDRLGPALEAL